MCTLLFPEARHPSVIAAIVGGRVVLNGVLVLLVARTVGSMAVLTTVVSGVVVFSGMLMMLALRPNRFGVRTAHTELLTHGAVLVLTGYAIAVNPSVTHVIASVCVGICAIVLLVIMLLVYGEALVAP